MMTTTPIKPPKLTLRVLKSVMDPGGENWRGDNLCERSEHVSWPAPRVQWHKAPLRE